MEILKRKPRKLVDAMIKPPYPGDHIAISWILEEEVLVTAFKYLASQFENRRGYLAIQIERGDKRQWFTTESKFILDYFERVSQDMLPCRVTFSRVKDEGGHRCYSVS